MTTEAEKFFEECPAKMQGVYRETPDISRAFRTFFQSTMKEGSLTVREKELIALAIAVAVRCVPRINAHAEKAISAGATREQIMEAAGVAVMMRGGPAFSHLPHVLEAVSAIEGEHSAIGAGVGSAT